MSIVALMVLHSSFQSLLQVRPVLMSIAPLQNCAITANIILGSPKLDVLYKFKHPFGFEYCGLWLSDGA